MVDMQDKAGAQTMLMITPIWPMFLIGRACPLGAEGRERGGRSARWAALAWVCLRGSYRDPEGGGRKMGPTSEGGFARQGPKLLPWASHPFGSVSAGLRTRWLATWPGPLRRPQPPKLPVGGVPSGGVPARRSGGAIGGTASEAG